MTRDLVHHRLCGRLHDEEGKVLIVLEPMLERRQLLVLARELGVPYRT